MSDIQAPASAGATTVTPEFIQKVTSWYELKAKLAEMVLQERNLRIELFGAAFPAPREGVNRMPLGYGRDLVGEPKVNYSVDREEMQAHSHLLPADVFNAVMKFTPEVRAGALKAVTDEEHKRVFGLFVTAKPGLPDLSISNTKKR